MKANYRAILFGFVIATPCGVMPAHAAPRVAEAGNYAQLDKLPDWSGAWALDDESFAKVRQTTDSPDANNANVPKLKQEFWDFRMLNKVQNKGVDGKGAYNNAMECIPDGMPGVMSIPMEYEYLLVPGMVVIHTGNGEIRRIYTDGRKMPADPVPSFEGTSIGHWEGDTLVVETTGILNKSEMFVGLRLTGDTRVTERIHKVSDDQLRIDTVVYNDTMLNEPFKYFRTYKRIAQMYEALCMENNRDNNDTVDLTPPAE